MAVFWFLVLGSGLLMLWWFALKAAFEADARARLKKRLEKRQLKEQGARLAAEAEQFLWQRKEP
jgi:ribosome assembly protein YihI (activator of Der GTPase)